MVMTFVAHAQYDLHVCTKHNIYRYFGQLSFTLEKKSLAEKKLYTLEKA